MPVAVTAAAKGSAMVVGAVVGGLVAGVLGAVLWGGIAYETHIHLRIMALGVGVLTGFGVALGSGNRTSTATGLLAAAIAIAAVCGGKYAEVTFITNEFTNTVLKVAKVDNATAMGMMAQDVVAEWNQAGKAMVWPDGMDPESAKEADREEEFPKAVWAEATRRWNDATPDWKQQYKSSHEAALHQEFRNAMGEVTNEGFTHSFGFRDVFYLIFAVIGAYGIGSGTGLPTRE